MSHERSPESISRLELTRYLLDLVRGKSDDKKLILAVRASVAGGVSVTTAIAGFATNRLEIAAAGGVLTFLSGFIALNAVNSSRRLD